MTRLVRTTLGLIAAFLVLSGAARAAEQVDLLLVLASDVSRSVDTRKFELQRQGYAAALSNPRVTERSHRDLLPRVVGCDLAEARDRLDHR